MSGTEVPSRGDAVHSSRSGASAAAAAVTNGATVTSGADSAASSSPSAVPSSASAAASGTSGGAAGDAPVRRSCLLVIDVQNDFVAGSLAAPDAEAIIPRINALRAGRPWSLAVFTGDAHPPEHVSFHANHAHNPAARLFEPLTLPSGLEQVMWPVHCVSGTWGAQLHPDLAREADADLILEKGVKRDQEYYSAFMSTCGRHQTHLTALLRERRITDVVVCGLVFEYCVGNSALDAARAGFHTTLVTDCTRGLTEEGMEAMTKKLQAAGVALLDAQHVPLDTEAQVGPSATPAGVDQQQRPPDWPTCRSASIASATPSRAPSTAAPTAASSAASSSNGDSFSTAVTPVQSAAPSRSNSLLSSQDCSSSSLSNSAATVVPLPASPPAAPRPRILVGFSGSVATIKASELLASLSQFAEVRAITTQRALHFFSAEAVQRDLGVRVYRDEDEWRSESSAAATAGSSGTGGLWQRGDSVLHIELRRWADLLVIAPLSANTLAKLSHGLCDNLLSTLVRAWPCDRQPLLLAPAMNTLMWESPFTARQLRMLQELGPETVRVLAPQDKLLACGDTGRGAMASVEEISKAARQTWEGMLQRGYKQQPPPPAL